MASIRKRTWTSGNEVKTAWVADYFDQHGKRHIKTFPLKKDADAWLHKTVGQVNEGVHTAERNSRTVAEAAQAWLKRGEREQLERSTLASYERHVRLSIIPFMGNTKLANLNKPLVNQFKGYLQDKFTNRNMQSMVLISLKGIIKEAMEQGWIAHDPAKTVTIDLKSRDQVKLEVGVHIPDSNEIRALIDNAQDRWRPLIITAIFTGLRSSELRGLRWSDVKFDQKEIHVRQRADEYQKIGNVKTKGSKREIPITSFVINTLKGWQKDCPKGELDLVFPSGAGNIEHHSNILHRGLHALEIELGMVDSEGKPKYGLHSLRHFAASNWIEGGFDIKKIQTRMGHSSATMTLDRYGHLMKSNDDQDKLEARERALLAG